MNTPGESTITDARRVLRRIADVFPAWMSPDVLADDMDTTRPHVERVLHNLEAGGVVARNGTTFRLAGQWPSQSREPEPRGA